MRSSVLLVVSLLFISSCVTTQPANFFSIVPSSITEISEFNIQLDARYVPLIVDYRRADNNGMAAQTAAMSFGVVGAVVGSLLESAINGSKTSSARYDAESKANSLSSLYNTESIEPVIRTSLETALTLDGKSARQHLDAPRLKITPVIGTNDSAKILLLKLTYEIFSEGSVSSYKNDVIWQTRRDKWDGQSINRALNEGVKEAVEVIVAELSGKYSYTDDVKHQKISMYSAERGNFNGKVQVIDWSDDRKSVRFKRQYSRVIMSASDVDFVYIHSSL